MSSFRIGLKMEDFCKWLVVAPIEESPDGSCDVSYPALFQEGMYGSPVPGALPWVSKHFKEKEKIQDDDDSPLLRIPGHWAQPLYEALRDQFNYGEAERVLRVELEATKKHLEDMRRLVFEPKEKAVTKEETLGAESESLPLMVYFCPDCQLNTWKKSCPQCGKTLKSKPKEEVL